MTFEGSRTLKSHYRNVKNKISVDLINYVLCKANEINSSIQTKNVIY